MDVAGTSLLKFSFGNKNLSFKFYVVKSLPRSLILGSDFLSAFNLKWDFQKRTVSIGNTVVLLRDKRNEKVGLVRTTHSLLIPPKASMVLQCTLPKRCKGEYIVSPLNNSTLFYDQPGFLSAPSLVSTSNVSSVGILVKNETGRFFKVRQGQVVATCEIFDSQQQSVNEVSTTECKETLVKDLEFDLSSVPDPYLPAFKKLLSDNRDLFAQKDIELGRTNIVKMNIETGDHPPIKQRPYRIPFAQRSAVDKSIDEMLEADIIRPSCSPWSSPLVIVTKKDGTARMCVDYRRMNQVTKKDSYPLPDISEMLSSFKNAKYFTTIDLKSGYWQLEVEEQDKEKTAFCCYRGLFEFNVLPFGLCGGPPVFQRAINYALQGTQGFACAFLDDIIVYSGSIEEHLEHIRIVFQKLREANLRMKPSKCVFVTPRVEFLGHIVSKKGIEPNPEKVQVIKYLKPPKTVREVRSFLGMVGYYHRFINNFGNIAIPLYRLTKKNARFSWNDECQQAFDTLKTKLCEAPILAHPDVTKPYKLYTDASGYAVGAVLTQDFPEGERPIQYISQSLNKGRRNYSTFEREAYAIIYAIKKLRHYLYGQPFTVFTDHRPLKSLFTAEMQNTRVRKWAIVLSEYNLSIEYKTGKSNVLADMLSRIPPSDGDVMVLDSAGGRVQDKEERKQVEENAIPEEGAQDPEEEVPPLDLLNGLEEGQQEDETLGAIRNALSDGEDVADYIMCNDGLLYRVSRPVRKDDGPRLQLCVPKKSTSIILNAFHDSPFGGGHSSIEKTYDKIRRRYYWPTMYRDVTTYVSQCDICKARKTKRLYAPMQDVPIPNFPFETLAIDTCGPFPESSSGNKYIITFIDHLTCWPEAYCTKDKTSETVASLILTKIIPRHSCPQVLLSDNGTEFVNSVISELTERLRVAHFKTSPYRPQANGRLERLHRYMNDVISKYTYKHPLEWDTYVPYMLMSYRTSVQDSSLFSPFFLLYGRDPILPMDTLLQPKLKYLGDDYVPTMLQRLHEAYLEARQHLADARDRNKERINAKAREKSFEPGDAVYNYNHATKHGESSKLKMKWLPFYRIVEQKSPVTYLIKHQKTGLSKTVHVNDLQLANPQETWEKVWDTQDNLEPVNKEGAMEETVLRHQPMRRCRLVNPDLSIMPRLGQQLDRRRSLVKNPQEPPRSPGAMGENPVVPPIRLSRRRARSLEDEWEVADAKRAKIEETDMLVE